MSITDYKGTLKHDEFFFKLWDCSHALTTNFIVIHFKKKKKEKERIRCQKIQKEHK